MNLDQRKSLRIQIPEWRERAILFLGNHQAEVRILDEPAGGFAVALLVDEEIQQNQVLLLKTATGIYQTRVVRIEHFDDGKLLGLLRLQDVSDASEEQLQDVSDASEEQLRGPAASSDVFAPASKKLSRGTLAAGICAVFGALLCGLVMYFVNESIASRTAASPVLKEVSETEQADTVREVPKKTQPAAMEIDRPQLSKTSPEVLYRLRLNTDQSRRIRDILSRSSGDLETAEREILDVLSPEQASQWETLAQ